MDILETITKYWHVITGAILLILAWGKARTTDKEHEKRITKLEKELDSINPVFLDIKERLVSIETKLEIWHNERNPDSQKLKK